MNNSRIETLDCLRGFKLSSHLSVVLGMLHLCRQEQIHDKVFCQERAAQDSHNLIDVSIQKIASFSNCDCSERFCWASSTI